MKNIELIELIDWFNNYFDNCYCVKHMEYPNSVFMFYDINYIRQLKLAKIEEKKAIKTTVTGVCLFELDFNGKCIYCNYDLIWCYLKDKYTLIYDDIQIFIKHRLLERKLNLTPVSTQVRTDMFIEDFFI